MEIIKGYCCHSKEVCSWPSFLSLLSKVNRLNWTARITKRGAFLAWISPPKKFLCSLLDSQVSWVFRTGSLTENPSSSTFVSLLLFRQWQQKMRLAALPDSQQLLALWHWNAGAHLAHRRLWQCDIDTGHSYRERAASAQTAFPGMSPCMASPGTESTAGPLSEAPELLHSAVQ